MNLRRQEILEQVTVLNLDTGERVPLSVAEDKLPQGINPLSLHIMRLTSEYVSDTNLEKQKESDEESVDSKVSEIPTGKDLDRRPMRRKTDKIKKFLGSTVKKTMDKAKSLAQEVMNEIRLVSCEILRNEVLDTHDTVILRYLMPDTKKTEWISWMKAMQVNNTSN